ncbi:MAG TPA: IS4 family transposase [Verrucomicrobiae bacterium]|nr:IS4 family transposase [Verrucomicrobiae bacterium]
MKKNFIQANAGKLSILRQLCNLIPAHLVSKLARETGVEEQWRTFSPWSQVVALLYAQITHALGLNDVCDALRLHSGPLSALRGATPPPKNTFSHANRTRDPQLAEKLFWSVLEHLQTLAPGFAGQHTPRFAFRFKRLIHVVDTTTIQLMARSLDWAKHRRRKAAAKCHVRLNLQSFLPTCVIVGSAAEHDNVRARELCANIQAGEIAIFDRAYVDFAHLADLSMREVFWVTRAKDNLQFRVVRKLQEGTFGNILRDDLIELTGPAAKDYPVPLRRVVARVEVDGEIREMVFLTNNFSWSAQTIADLYRCRWSIETFFKELKQTLQLADFLGHNAQAVRWQVWTALLAYLLLRFCAWLGRWSHSFTRLFALLRSALWQKLDLRSLLESYGTAQGGGRFLGQPQQAYLAGFG